MAETIWFGQDNQLMQIPREMWEQHLAEVPRECQKLLKLMSGGPIIQGALFNFS